MAHIKEFSSSLLREKFIIHDINPDLDKKPEPVIAVSNRMVVEIKNHRGNTVETFIVRSQNMHSCVRMAARLLQTFENSGPITKRSKPYNWEAAWKPLVNDFEQMFNPEIWVAIYQNGKQVYKDGDVHPFLDMIEKIDYSSTDKYEETIPLAEAAFKNTGKNVRIEYKGNVALVVQIEENMARCAVILRGAKKTTTFNYTSQPKNELHINMPHCLGSAASFLEGIQLAFRIGIDEHKINVGIIARRSKDEEFVIEGHKRLQDLNVHIVNLEDAYEVRYRPERPLFQHIMMDATKFAQKTIAAPIRPAKDEGGADSEEAWVD